MTTEVVYPTDIGSTSPTMRTARRSSSLSSLARTVSRLNPSFDAISVWGCLGSASSSAINLNIGLIEAVEFPFDGLAVHSVHRSV